MGFILNICTSPIFKRAVAFSGFLIFAAAMIGQEIPKKFQKSDQNKNGVIEVHEVNNAIDYLFIGSKGYTTAYIHELIDFYYQQKNK